MWIMNRSEAAWSKWAGLIEEQGASGWSAGRFCAERGVPTSSFFAWKRKIRERAGGSLAPRSSAAFVEAKVRDAAEGPHGVGGMPGVRDVGANGGVAIELPRGARIIVERGFDRELLREVIGVLEAGTPQGGDGALS
jgi:hypothetical protein